MAQKGQTAIPTGDAPLLIERTESESIFVKILVSEPIILEASHGGGGGKAQTHTKTPPQENIRYGRACYEGQVHY